MLKALEDQDSNVRWSATGALAQLSSVEVIPELLKALEHQDSDVRGSAAEALEQLGSVEAIPGLLKALEDQDSNIRGSAINALGKISNSKPLAELWRVQFNSSNTPIFYGAIAVIQNRCKFYNHEIARTVLNLDS